MRAMNLTDLFEYSQKNNAGIGMFNVVNLEFAKAIFEAAQETGIPVMLGVPERFYLQNYYDADSVAAVCRTMIKRSEVPVALHLDHGKHFNGVMEALKNGFSSVMFDGSSLSYEENVKQTAEIVKIAHAMGVTVEGELGYVGSNGIDNLTEDNFTKPEQAKEFVERTGVDALAVAIGNQHGQYKGTPDLDFERLKAIRRNVSCGLVLHGGSGIADADFLEAIHCGINKVNIYTAMDIAARDFNEKHFKEYHTYLDYSKDLISVVKDVVRDHMLLFAGRRAV